MIDLSFAKNLDFHSLRAALRLTQVITALKSASNYALKSWDLHSLPTALGLIQAILRLK